MALHSLTLLADSLGLERHLAQLQRLPPQTQASINAENEEEAYDVPVTEEPPDLKDVELPPEL